MVASEGKAALHNRPQKVALHLWPLRRQPLTCDPPARPHTVQVGSRVSSMEWGPNPRLMSVVTADGISACRKTLLRHRFRDGYVVIQSGVDQLMVELMDGLGRPPAKLRAKVQMLGLDISKGTLLVYDGTRADLYKVCGAVKGGLGGLGDGPDVRHTKGGRVSS